MKYKDPADLTTAERIEIMQLAKESDAVWSLRKRALALAGQLEQERRERNVLIDQEVFDRMAQATTTEATRYFRDALAVFKIGELRYVVQPGWGDRPEINVLTLGKTE